MILQNDNGTAEDANSYVTSAQLLAYWLERNVDLSTHDDEVLEAACVTATSYIDARFSYRGRKLNTREQSTEFPRSNLYDRDRNYVNGVPREVKNACHEYAKRALTGDLNPDPTADESGRVVQSKREKVDVLEEEVSYVVGGAFMLPKYPAADLILKRAGFVTDSSELRRG